MNGLRRFLDNQEKHFGKNGRFERLHPLFEAVDTFLFTPANITRSASFIRDVINVKRVMITVVIALLPCVFMALYNTGLQANLALERLGAASVPGLRGAVLRVLGTGISADNTLACVMHGALYFVPVYFITLAVGGAWESLFAVLRKSDISEGFLVTSLLFPLTLPPGIPLWQAALGISFGVVVGKEIFGGSGRNIFNPALTGRAFLFFAYPAQITGDAVWVAVDGVTKATPLAEAAAPSMPLSVSWLDAFIGTIPGSMGETSTLACLLGACILIITGIASWRIMIAVTAGMFFLASLLNIIGSTTNPMFQLTPAWHFVLGGFAFGTVFMTTDPVTGAMTRHGMYLYGFLIGALTVMIRAVNPAFPEGIMLAILFCNMFAPIIDRVFLNAGIKRRMARSGG